jgi:hypothetical protein
MSPERFVKGESERTRSAGFRFGFTVFSTCRTQPKRIGWRSATPEFDVLLLALTVWAFLTGVSTTPAADRTCTC